MHLSGVNETKIVKITHSDMVTDLHMQIRIYRLRLGSNCQFKKIVQKKYQILIVLNVQAALFLFFEEIFQAKKLNPFELRQQELRLSRFNDNTDLIYMKSE